MATRSVSATRPKPRRRAEGGFLFGMFVGVMIGLAVSLAIAFYLRDLAGEFHSYYNAERILVEDEATRTARLALCAAVRQVLANGLALLGVGAPERM